MNRAGFFLSALIHSLHHGQSLFLVFPSFSIQLIYPRSSPTTPLPHGNVPSLSVLGLHSVQTTFSPTRFPESPAALGGQRRYLWCSCGCRSSLGEYLLRMAYWPSINVSPQFLSVTPKIKRDILINVPLVCRLFFVASLCVFTIVVFCSWVPITRTRRLPRTSRFRCGGRNVEHSCNIITMAYYVHNFDPCNPSKSMPILTSSS